MDAFRKKKNVFVILAATERLDAIGDQTGSRGRSLCNVFDADSAEQYAQQTHGNRQRTQPEDKQQQATEDHEGSKAGPLDDAKKRT